MDRQKILRGFRIKGLGITTYCKVTAVGHKITLSFGTKLRNFCVIIKHDLEKPTELYLDRVDSDGDCIMGGRLSDIKRGAVRFVKLALYTVKRWFPRVIVIRFQDDSKIRCNTSSFPLILPLDYISKYGKTWYEYHFHAEIDTDMNYKNKNGYYRGLEILTQPHREKYEDAADDIPNIEPFEAQYRASATPREFLNLIRSHLGDSYCDNGARLLVAYMKYLRINPIPQWKILMKDVESVPDFEREEITREEAKQMLNGGSYRTRRTHGGRTRRNRKARYQFSHEPDMQVYSIWN